MERALSKEEIGGYEKQLRSMLDSYTEQADKVSDNTLLPSGDPHGQREDENVEDTAIERESVVLATIDQLAYQVRDALDRVAEGTYGNCEDCERPIGRNRLEALPYASTCVSCAQKREQAEGRMRG